MLPPSQLDGVQPVTLTLQQFRTAVREFDGRVLTTQARSQPFRFRILPDALEFTPESTGEPRPERWNQVAGVLDRFNQTGSLRPGNYQDVTRNASYLLALLARIVEDQ